MCDTTSCEPSYHGGVAAIGAGLGTRSKVCFSYIVCQKENVHRAARSGFRVTGEPGNPAGSVSEIKLERQTSEAGNIAGRIGHRADFIDYRAGQDEKAAVD